MKSFKDMARTGEVKRADVGMKVKLDDIHEEPGFNVRDDTEEFKAGIEELANYIREGGVVPPIEVRPREDGGVWIVDGHRRTRAFRRAKESGLPVEWIDIRPFHGNDADRIARMATSNEGVKLTALETAAVYKRLRSLGLELNDIAKVVHKTPQHVSQLLTLGDSDVQLQQQVAAKVVSPTTAIKLARQHGSQASAKVVQLQAVAQTKGKKKVVPALVKPAGVKLSGLEAYALDLFVSAHHEKWKEVAETLMDADERRHLESRLAEAADKGSTSS